MIPEWANEKQKEGMMLLAGIDEYSILEDLRFEQSTHSWMNKETSFIAMFDLFGRKPTHLRVRFDAEAVWNSAGDRLHKWQIDMASIGCSDPCWREMSLEMIGMKFMDIATSGKWESV